jgi:uncharacterized membrane protein YgdD (TMEM256/DUF423 family)
MDKTMVKSIFNKKNIAQILLTSIMMVMIASMTVFAADNTWAKNGSDWIRSGASYIVTAVIAFFAIKYLLQRKIIQFISFIVLAGLILVIVNDPGKLGTIGNGIYTAIFG